jgi:hypothetical protein
MTENNYKVGYKRPPLHTRFQPGQSGNPSGRAKGSKNLKTLFNRILAEEISLREGADVRKVTKAEALLRGLIVGALKGESRSLGTLFRLAEHTGHFEDEKPVITGIARIIVDTGVPRHSDAVRNEDPSPGSGNVVPFPAGRDNNTD